MLNRAGGYVPPLLCLAVAALDRFPVLIVGGVETGGSFATGDAPLAAALPMVGLGSSGLDPAGYQIGRIALDEYPMSPHPE